MAYERGNLVSQRPRDPVNWKIVSLPARGETPIYEEGICLCAKTHKHKQLWNWFINAIPSLRALKPGDVTLTIRKTALFLTTISNAALQYAARKRFLTRGFVSVGFLHGLAMQTFSFSPTNQCKRLSPRCCEKFLVAFTHWQIAMCCRNSSACNN